MYPQTTGRYEGFQELLQPPGSDFALQQMVRLLQPLNAESPIFVTPSGMTMPVREEHLENAEFPIEVTLSGMTMLVREVQPTNASSPMVVTPSGMMMLVREERPLKAESAIAVTLIPPIFSGITASESVPAHPNMVIDSSPFL